jgi:hypothetical protein
MSFCAIIWIIPTSFECAFIPHNIVKWVVAIRESALHMVSDLYVYVYNAFHSTQYTMLFIRPSLADQLWYGWRSPRS